MHSFVPSRRLVPALLTSVVALGAVASSASAAGSQAFDVTTRLQCDRPFYGPVIYVQAPPSEAFDVRVTGIAPATTAPGETVQLTDVSATAQLAENPARYLPADYDLFRGYLANFSLGVTGATPSSIPLSQQGGNLSATRTATGWPAMSLGSFAATPLATAGADPVVISAGQLKLNFKIINHAPIQLADLGLEFTCTPAANAAPIVTIANSGTPVIVGPVVKSVSGSAIANLGGFVQVRGSKLSGAKYVTVGTRRVSPLASSATSSWIWAPALAKGTYPVSVTTAAGTSAPAPTAKLTYR